MDEVVCSVFVLLFLQVAVCLFDCLMAKYAVVTLGGREVRHVV